MPARASRSPCPIFDIVHRAQARGVAAEAAHAVHEADMIRDQFFDNRLRARHTAAELNARAPKSPASTSNWPGSSLTSCSFSLKTGTGNLSGPQMTPKDEQTSRIAEREKFIAVLNANFEAQQAQINLMRATGELEYLDCRVHSRATP